MEKVSTTLQLTKDDLEFIKKYCKENDVSVAKLFRDMIREIKKKEENK